MNDLEDALRVHLHGRAADAQPVPRLEEITGRSIDAAFESEDESTSEPIVLAWETRRKPPTRRRTLFTAAAAVAVIGGGLFILAGRRVPSGEDRGAASPPGQAVAPAGPPIDWSNPRVRFTADSFEISADGKVFTGATEDMEVRGDPGNSEYQTLELTWHEHGVEQRWYVYFQSDGTEWWSEEFRVYDGTAASEWSTFTGDFFRRPVGEAFTGDIDVSSSDGRAARLVIRNATLQPFTDTGVAPPTLDLASGLESLPADLPSTWTAYSARDQLVVFLAEQAILGECLSEQGLSVAPVDVAALTAVSGAWQPDPALGVLTSAGAAGYGYHFPDHNTYTIESRVPDGERESVFRLLGDAWPEPTGCRADYDTAVHGLSTQLTVLASDAVVDTEPVGNSTLADQRVADAIDAWSACLEQATGEQYATPNEAARAYGLAETPATEHEITVALADVDCQAMADVEGIWRHVYAEYLRAAVAQQAPDQLDDLDQRARLKADLVAASERELAERGISIG